jgi:hypothetical protein
MSILRAFYSVIHINPGITNKELMMSIIGAYRHVPAYTPRFGNDTTTQQTPPAPTSVKDNSPEAYANIEAFVKDFEDAAKRGRSTHAGATARCFIPERNHAQSVATRFTVGDMQGTAYRSVNFHAQNVWGLFYKLEMDNGTELELGLHLKLTKDGVTSEVYQANIYSYDQPKDQPQIPAGDFAYRQNRRQNRAFSTVQVIVEGLFDSAKRNGQLDELQGKNYSYCQNYLPGAMRIPFKWEKRWDRD